jgi:branched-chain amino acid transport system ATP-binding protein
VSTLEIRDLRAGYGQIEVLHGVDLTFPDRATVAIVGRNGAGKSTLLRCVAGLVPQRGGCMQWDGDEIRDRSAYERALAGIVLVPEQRNVFPSLTVRENLELFAHGEPIDPAVAAFPEIERFLERRAGTLSGGERQMVALSHALLRPAQLLLFDEVSRGLSPAVAARFYDRVVALTGTGRTNVIVEQYLDDALRVADIVYVLRRGEVAFVGEPGELRDATEIAAS